MVYTSLLCNYITWGRKASWSGEKGGIRNGWIQTAGPSEGRSKGMAAWKPNEHRTHLRGESEVAKERRNIRLGDSCRKPIASSKESGHLRVSLTWGRGPGTDMKIAAEMEGWRRKALKVYDCVIWQLIHKGWTFGNGCAAFISADVWMPFGGLRFILI